MTQDDSDKGTASKQPLSPTSFAQEPERRLKTQGQSRRKVMSIAEPVNMSAADLVTTQAISEERNVTAILTKSNQLINMKYDHMRSAPKPRAMPGSSAA